MGGTSWGSIFIALLDFIKSMFWPGLVLFIILNLNQPIGQLARVLPDILQRTKEIEVAGGKLVVNSSTPGPTGEVAETLKDLNENSLRYLLERSAEVGMGRCTNYKRNENEIDKLLTLKLLTEDFNQSNKDCPSTTRLTELGRRTKEYLTSIVLAQIYPGQPTR